jgi:alcohol dehydrogenase YqhD (iron-dependent ADH family)
MEDFYRLIDMPTTLTELGIAPTPDQIKTLAYKCSFKNTRTVGVIKKLGMDDMATIYQMAL